MNDKDRKKLIEEMIAANTKDIIHRDEFDDLMARAKYVETKLRIELGK